MAMGSIVNALIEIGGTQIRHLVYVGTLQDEMLLGIDFMHEQGVQLHCSTGEFRVGASLTIQPMFKACLTSLPCKLSRCVACVYLHCQWE